MVRKAPSEEIALHELGRYAGAMFTNAECPKCGFNCLLATAACMVIVAQGGRAGVLYGRPEVLMLKRDAPVICNFTGCGWEGTTADLRDRNVSNVSD